jgi:hypothetical protein
MEFVLEVMLAYLLDAAQIPVHYWVVDFCYQVRKNIENEYCFYNEFSQV